MEIIYNKIFLEHETGSHPENKKRLEVFGKLKEQEIIDGSNFLKKIYSLEYIDFIQKRGESDGFLDADTLVSGQSYKTACFAVGASIMASETGSFALIRPPGHHAGINKGGGFCLLNNIAIASKRLTEKGKKVFILDIDGHHGNGTQEIFYNSNKVFYFSIHQYPAYPGTGWLDEIGKEKGKFYNINIPLPPESGDDLFLKSIIDFLPFVKKFKPDVVAFSAGFDGHWADPLLNLNFSLNSYYQLGKIISKNFDNIFAVLEGGYNLSYLPKCVYNFIAGLNQEKIKFEEKATISRATVKEEYQKRIVQLKNFYN